jgi:hypothetical protein
VVLKGLQLRLAFTHAVYVCCYAINMPTILTGCNCRASLIFRLLTWSQVIELAKRSRSIQDLSECVACHWEKFKGGSFIREQEVIMVLVDKLAIIGTPVKMRIAM